MPFKILGSKKTHDIFKNNKSTSFLFENCLSIESDQKYKFTTKLKSPSIYKRNPCKNYSDQKKIKSEIGSQKYPLVP